jgi:Aminoglycoside-2''-adenylyltransferase
MAGHPAPWWIAGGWAIDLHLGRETRPHADIDVLVLRADLPAIRDRLRGWDLHAADPPGQLRPWLPSEALPERVHDVWCRPTPEDPWRLQLMIDEAVEGEWIYRQHPHIRRAVAGLRGPASTPGRPVLTPEIQLLHKSRHPRPKDEADFLAVLPALDERQRRWLLDALSLTAPAHPWRAPLHGDPAADLTAAPPDGRR